MKRKKNTVAAATTIVLLATIGAPHAVNAQIAPHGTSDYELTVERHHGDRVTPHWAGIHSVPVYWPGGAIQWYFNPANIPTNLTYIQVLGAMHLAASRWSQMCNIKFTYMGTTNVAQGATVAEAVDRVNVWGFFPFPESASEYSGATKNKIFTPSGEAYAILLDSDIELNPALKWDQTMLDGTLTHEIGHAIGIGHSNVSASIMSSTPYNTASYMRTLRADDVNACTSLYGAAPSQLTNRALNWAEHAYPDLLPDTAAMTQSHNGYTYRYYPSTKSYAMSKGVNAYYQGPDGIVQYLGPLIDYGNRINAAGF